jgi:hypothetical protein
VRGVKLTAGSNPALSANAFQYVFDLIEFYLIFKINYPIDYPINSGNSLDPSNAGQRHYLSQVTFETSTLDTTVGIQGPKA